jgi:hypothetical protein
MDADDIDDAENAETPQNSQFPDDILTPEGVYESSEALFVAANAWAKASRLRIYDWKV